MRARATVGLSLALGAIAYAGPREAPPAKLDDACVDQRPGGAGTGDAGCRKHALDHFTAAIAQHKSGKPDHALRVAFFGDSLTASDSIANGLRERLGALVGAGGPGFVWAEKPHPYCEHHAVTRWASGSWTVWGISTAVPADRLLGLGGSAEGSGSIRLAPVTPVTSVDVHYLEQPKGGAFAIVADGSIVTEVDTAGEHKKAAFSRVELPAASKKLELRTTRGRVRLFGASLEANKGAVVDNLGVINATAKGLARNDMPEHLRNQLAHRAPDLVIVMLGTNEAEWLLPRGAGMVEHEQVFDDLLASIRAANPEASCLVISPFDQIDWKAEGSPARASVPAMVDAQHRSAAAHGCAFWNAYEWMGGKGSSMTWYKRGLVVNDFQHPTTQGANRIAEALYAGLVR